MRGRLSILIALVGLAIILAFSSSTASHTSNDSNTVTDLSWPNCQVKTVNSPSGIVGINGGLDFHANPCAYYESSLFSTYAVYLNTGYPGPSYGKKFANTPDVCGPKNNICLAYNYGYNAALYSINYASLHGVHSYVWWLDVESSNSWTSNYMQNRAELSGMIAAIYAHTFLPTVGIYSYPGQWNAITNYWKNDIVSWVATGTSSHKVATKACSSKGFDGGLVELSQYTTALDNNYLCQQGYSSYLKI
jgi:hypothetical protein